MHPRCDRIQHVRETMGFFHKFQKPQLFFKSKWRYGFSKISFFSLLTPCMSCGLQALSLQPPDESDLAECVPVELENK